MQHISKQLSKEGKKLGFVPTMGALHSGHISLIEKSIRLADITVVSIFVNPTQFAPHEDFSLYPRPIEDDLEKCKQSGVDIVFLPERSDIYPEGSGIMVDVGEIGLILEGITRPHFFNGVATVVSKLFNIVLPDFAVFGQKDLQQSVIIQRLIREYKYGIKLIVAPIIRESNGLAMSSRNVYLNTEQKEEAGVLFQSIQKGIKAVQGGITDRKIINAHVIEHIRKNSNLKIDYVQTLSVEDLSSPDHFLPGEKVAIVIAAFSGKTRLIDNSITIIPNGYNDTLEDEYNGNFKELEL
ncbi:MAG: pantoate--beta-alanine ligase [Candidatus Kapaibacteriales bacterium]